MVFHRTPPLHKSSAAPCGRAVPTHFSRPSPGPPCGSLHRQHHCHRLSQKTRRTKSPTLNAISQSILRLCESWNVLLLPQFIAGSLDVMADTLSRWNQVLGSEWTLCADIFRDLQRRWSVSVDLFSTNLNHQLPVYFFLVLELMSAGTGAMLQAWDGLEVYAFPPFALVNQVLPKLHDSCRPLLASEDLVSGAAGPSGGRPCGPSAVSRPSSSAALSPPTSEPLRASADCVATIQRAAHRHGLSSAVAKQLAFCRRRSTRLNYQSKWSIYCSWCHSHGHSVSRPSIAKISDNLLFLRRQHSVSYSSISGFHSMLSAVFLFSLPELSSCSVIKDLLCSFHLERPSVPLSAPSWDLSVELRFLRSSPFEPLSEVSLRQFTKKTLFLLSLATALNVKLPLYCSLVPDPQAVLRTHFGILGTTWICTSSLPFFWSVG